MAGYLGSKAVLLSTTAANVTGNADIGGDLTVDTNTLYVDSTNNNVGIGTSSPTNVKLQINDSLSGTAGTGHLAFGETTSPFWNFRLNTSTADLLLDRSYGGWQSTPVIAFERSSGNVGIGTDSPSTYSGAAGTKVLAVGSTSGNNGVNVVSGTTSTGSYMFSDSGGNDRGGFTYFHTADLMTVKTAGSEAMRIDSSGNLLVGGTSVGANDSVTIAASGYIDVSGDGVGGYFNREGSDGEIVRFLKDNTTVGSIGSTAGGGIYIQSQETDTTSSAGALVSIRDAAGGNRLTLGGTNAYGFIGDQSGSGVGISFISTSVRPFSTDDMADKDNLFDMGTASFRWNDAYITNGVTTGSDGTAKQQIASLTDAEMQAANALRKLFKTFKWNDAVERKGDAARKHTGVIAQDVQQTLIDQGLDPSDYAFFMSNTWWETQTEVPAVEAVEEVLDEEGNVVVEAVEAQEAYTRTDTYDTLEEAPEGATERNRKGIRYPELLSFIGAATEQRLASIEARLDALEGV